MMRLQSLKLGSQLLDTAAASYPLSEPRSQGDNFICLGLLPLLPWRRRRLQLWPHLIFMVCQFRETDPLQYQCKLCRL